MNKHKIFLSIICMAIFLGFFVQAPLKTKFSLFICAEEEQGYGVKDFRPEKYARFIGLSEAAIIPVLTNPDLLFVCLTNSNTPTCQELTFPFIGRFFNHSPPILL